jgi:hypothetical protein
VVELYCKVTIGYNPRSLLLLSVGIFGVLSVWYVGAAVFPLMRDDTALRPNGLSNAEGSLLTSSASVGVALSVKVAGLAQKLGQLEAVNRDFQSQSWANLKILGQPCNVRDILADTLCP